MKKDENSFHRFKSLSDFHAMFGLEKPKHPLISFFDIGKMQYDAKALPASLVLDFYKIAYKSNLCGRAKYGQHYYDFNEGGLVFTSPGQVFESPTGAATSGFMLLIHPDFLLSYPLAKEIKRFGFFSYAANEALHLSEREKEIIMLVFNIIDEELKSRIDDFSQDVIVAQLELLLNYSNRFYKRQFLTRKAASNDYLQRVEEILDIYFNNDNAATHGIPTVQYLANELNLSPGYLSDMLRSLTGQNAQQVIHGRLIERAKNVLSTSDLSVAEIAYTLGFEHPQSFSRLFKAKTNQSPFDFRKSFN